jgi:hypothetical protein
MSLIPVRCLGSADLFVLGQNVARSVRRDYWELRAVNRSLATHDEQVSRLLTIRVPATPARRRSRSLN